MSVFGDCRRGIIALTYVAKLALHSIGILSAPQRGEQRGQIDQIGGAKSRTACRHDDETILRLDAGPARGQPQQIAIGITVEDPVFTPSLLSIDEIDFPANEGMKWVCNSHRRRQFSGARCSSLSG